MRLPRGAFLFAQLERVNHSDDAAVAQRVGVIGVGRKRSIFERAKRTDAISGVVVMAPHQAHRERQEQWMLEEQFLPSLRRPAALADEEVLEPQQLRLDDLLQVRREVFELVEQFFGRGLW